MHLEEEEWTVLILIDIKIRNKWRTITIFMGYMKIPSKSSMAIESTFQSKHSGAIEERSVAQILTRRNNYCKVPVSVIGTCTVGMTKKFHLNLVNQFSQNLDQICCFSLLFSLHLESCGIADHQIFKIVIATCFLLFFFYIAQN